jgi:NhaP-type Na+/H+ or K+/H+ antiporter
VGRSIRAFIHRAAIGVAVGSVCGAIIGAVSFWLTAWLRENPEEPAWIFANTIFGIAYGVLGGSILGLCVGLLYSATIRRDAQSR